MDAIKSNISQLNFRTPQQAIKAFYTLYNQGTVRDQLTKVFCRYTAMATTGKIAYDEEIASFVRLFDHLIALTGAMETLQQNGIKGKCPVCNRTGNPRH
ncbi:hypothetical protein ACFGVS_00615 [Mucilaginibacter sp. AW1-7]|uniref:hypothetical protein n=1 Tax=Mucilaginibacter sp. AW1-7 TaxID=3349874 RepID=UPI003F738E6F